LLSGEDHLLEKGAKATARNILAENVLTFYVPKMQGWGSGCIIDDGGTECYQKAITRNH
jgi:hypothetical protein